MMLDEGCPEFQSSGVFGFIARILSMEALSGEWGVCLRCCGSHCNFFLGETLETLGLINPAQTQGSGRLEWDKI